MLPINPELPLGSEVDDGRSRLDVVVPSWMVSIAAHVVFFFVVAIVLRGCTQEGAVSPKASAEAFRDVGLHVVRDAAATDVKAPAADAAPTEAMTRDEGQPQRQPSAVSDDSVARDLLSLPAPTGLPILGPGAGSSLRTPTDAKELLKSSGRREGGEENAGFGQTTFFDIEAKGSRFVYVLDRSGSMYDHGAIRAAKEELITSLSALEQTQQFQIIFYNQNFVELTNSDGRPGMQWATDINQTLARRFIAGVQPDGGTDHTPPLKKGLRYQPEHLFFLTDADQPQLSARELHEIKTLNASRTKIHCVEFGKGSELTADNFLKKLARENGGTYRYRDITRFGRKP